PDSSLVLSQSIKSFASSIHIGYSLSPVRFFAVYRLRSHDSPAIVEEPLFGGSREGYPAILFPHRNGQRSSRNRHFLCGVLDFRLNRRPVGFGHHVLLVRRQVGSRKAADGE